MAYNPNNPNGQATMANSAPVVIASDQGVISTGGAVASGATDSGNPIKMGGKFNSTLPTYTDGQRTETQYGSRGALNVQVMGAGSTTGAASSASGADGVSNSTAGLNVYTLPRVFNGTTWDRPLAAANALNSAGTGITTAQIVGQFDDSSPTAITENQFGNIRMSANRNLYGTIRDAAGNERGANVNSSNQLSVSVDNSNVSTNIAQLAGNTISSGVGTSGTGTLRVVDANDVGRTLKFATGSASSSGNNTIVAAGTNKLKVYAFSLTTTSTTSVTVKFQSGATGTDLWGVVLQAPTNVSVGANLAVTPPSYLFATASATLLNLNLSGAQTVQWSVAYFDEA